MELLLVLLGETVEDCGDIDRRGPLNLGALRCRPFAGHGA
jgi:hypothetical protein